MSLVKGKCSLVKNIYIIEIKRSILTEEAKTNPKSEQNEKATHYNFSNLLFRCDGTDYFENRIFWQIKLQSGKK
ncbi:hypothetical protein GCM10011506_20500 [Marivirga lumbricoides]|uniref:Uncharacterized protein n=1 Tax=Marivirga lumbricoides TaxID=1046115 RepID=A0ABQ1M7I5_9BACT|nr:hypothetical protein GCM10011506_20500 [Marivirga lumbricoides]